MTEPQQPAPGPAVEEQAPAQDPVMGLLHGHVPLTLLADLAELPCEQDAGSHAILRTEGEPDDAWWEPAAVADDPA